MGVLNWSTPTVSVFAMSSLLGAFMFKENGEVVSSRVVVNGSFVDSLV